MEIKQNQTNKQKPTTDTHTKEKRKIQCKPCVWLDDTLENSTALGQASFPAHVKARGKPCLHSFIFTTVHVCVTVSMAACGRDGARPSALSAVMSSLLSTFCAQTNLREFSTKQITKPEKPESSQQLLYCHFNQSCTVFLT